LQFGVSLRTVNRDLRTLEQAGVPLLGEHGVSYSLRESYRLAPGMFTREQAAASRALKCAAPTSGFGYL
jgi:predicted DNA-binding transcriptional regulator YafY